MTRTIITLITLFPSLLFAAEVLPLKSDDYTMTESHMAKHPKVQFPHDVIPDDQYQPVKEAKTLRIQFSKDRKEIKIPSMKISGKLTETKGNKRVYRFDGGSPLALGGASLTIEKTKKGLIATFTEYGSGVPVISSSRGDFKPVHTEA